VGYQKSLTFASQTKNNLFYLRNCTYWKPIKRRLVISASLFFITIFIILHKKQHPAHNIHTPPDTHRKHPQATKPYHPSATTHHTLKHTLKIFLHIAQIKNNSVYLRKLLLENSFSNSGLN
ncbi:MAG: hypothetical protein K2H14_06705, partial [Muribaculaceae bacterium]|nr:hypothetical protein [Muribaculaceae bacterium]